RQSVTGRLHLDNSLELRSGLLQICRISAGGAACDQVFSGVGVDHELLRLRAAHRTGIRLDGHKFQAAASQDSAVHGVMQIEAFVEARLVDVKGIAVLHGELAHAQEPRLGPRLVAKLGLNLIPDLRQLLVATQFAPGDGGHDLFMRHPQAQVGALAVLEAKHIVAHACPAAALLPGFARQNRRQKELLPDLVHLLAHDADNLVQRALAEKEIVVDARSELADVAGADEELVAGHFGVCRGLAKSRNEELGPALHRDKCMLSRRYLGEGAMNAESILNVRANQTGGASYPLMPLALIRERSRKLQRSRLRSKRPIFASVPKTERSFGRGLSRMAATPSATVCGLAFGFVDCMRILHLAMRAALGEFGFSVPAEMLALRVHISVSKAPGSTRTT